LIEPNNRLLAEGDTVVGPYDFVEVLHSIRPAGRDDFLGLPFPFGCGQFAGARVCEIAIRQSDQTNLCCVLELM
jgi:hypothetical protein